IDEEKLILGPYDRHVKQVSRRLGVRLSSRAGELRFQGPDDAVQALVPRVEGLLQRLRGGEKLGPLEVETALLASVDVVAERSRSVFGEALPDESQPRRMPTARTQAQATYLEALQDQDLVLATGPAGTGKTYLAVAAALQALRRGEVKRLVLTRPVVEAGEHLGFLPGDLEDKIDPYLRPLFDAMSDLLGPAQARRMRELDIVEIAPLAFMRGRTLARSFVILDEAQNATSGQLKMFLTRLGEGTRAVVTGDRTQSDLPSGQKGGLAGAIDRLQNMAGVSWIEFSKVDVQRSKLVQRIVEAYGEDD
ncbi:MAG: PhoH family protein, partial [Planctomycetes bacterium]|nr:PhoH family protein [Planctomycetota bacterium]